MHEAALSYEGMTDEEIFHNDYKEYECAGVHYGIGVIKASDKETAMDIADRMDEAMASAKRSSGMDMVFAQIRYDVGDNTYTYLLPSDEEALEVLKAGFGDTWEFDGKGYLKQIMDKAIGDIKGRPSAYHTEGGRLTYEENE